MDTAAGLVVVACAQATTAGRREILRFAGEAAPGEVAPSGLEHARRIAELEIKTHFAPWLYEWVCSTGAIDLATWEGGLSWWWFTPLSERSPLRSPLIVRLNRLLVTRYLLFKAPPGPLIWHDDAPAMRGAVTALARAAGRDLCFVSHKPGPRSMASLVARRAMFAIADLLRTAVIKLMGPDVTAMQTPDVLITTRFPVQWENQNQSWRERMVGNVPDALAARSCRVGYAATTSGGPLAWLKNLAGWRFAMQNKGIRPLRSFVSMGAVLRIQTMMTFWPAYLRWRRRHRAAPVMFDGLDVSNLLWDEMDRMTLDPDIPSSRLVARGMAGLVRKSPSLKYVIHPFEFQPLERAIWAGVQVAPTVKVVGLQTAIATSGQLGFLPHAPELRDHHGQDARRAPLPDLLMCYGSLSQSRFANVMGNRAIDGGALRYGALARLVDQDHDIGAIRARLGLPAGKTALLVACPIDAEEAWLLVRGALALAQGNDNVTLLFKFHYHTRLDDAVAPVAEATVPGRWRIFEAGLNELILACDCVISGATSVPYEALALGRPSLVFLAPAEWRICKAAETPEAFHFWSSQTELVQRFTDWHQGTAGIDDAIRRRALDQQMRLVRNAEEALAERLAAEGQDR
jgi:hypothetical protein